MTIDVDTLRVRKFTCLCSHSNALHRNRQEHVVPEAASNIPWTIAVRETATMKKADRMY